MFFQHSFLIHGEINMNTEPLPLQSDSLIEKMICDPAFSYDHPWFYNHPYSLRCELGIGNTDRVYMKSSYRRALEIFDILFPSSPDAMMYDFCIEDYTFLDKFYIKNILRSQKKTYKFLSDCYSKYPHRVVRNLPLESDCDEECIRRNRIICYSDNKCFNHKRLIKDQINGHGFTVSYISFENECIFSVYDERGCDIVFATREKMTEFFHKLEPYLLEYDLENMKERIIQ